MISYRRHTGMGLALGAVIFGTFVYAFILVSIQRARNDAGTDVATPPGWERRPTKGKP
jgi:hypothetical protein